MVLDIDRNRSVEVTIDGKSLAQGNDADDVFHVFDDLIAAVRAGDAAGIDAGMAGLQRAFDRVTAAQSRVGNDLSTIEANKTRLGEMRRASDARRSELEDANLADAITRMQQADAAHSAAVAAVGSSAKLSLLDYLR
jgi:flagellar hook-associated protein 3 FlgL